MSLASSLYLSETHLLHGDVSCTVDRVLVEEINLMLNQERLLDGDKSKVLSNFDRLFSSLCAQALTSLECAFLEELREHCITRLEAEFRFKKRLSSSEIQRWMNQRVAYVAKLSSTSVILLRLVTVFKRKQLQQRARLGQRKRTELTIDSGLTIYLARAVLQRAMRQAGVLRNLTSSFSKDVKVVGAGLELSIAGSTWWQSSTVEFGGINTDYAHFDEAIESPKAIVYLSEVGNDTGPTEYYPGLFESLGLTPLQELVSRVILSVGSNPSSALHQHFKGHEKLSSAPIFRNLFLRLPAEMRFNSHFGWDVPPKHELINEFMTRKHTVTGGPGTSLIFDGGRIVHRGGLIRKGERLVFQVVFGLNRGGLLRAAMARFQNSK